MILSTLPLKSVLHTCLAAPLTKLIQGHVPGTPPTNQGKFGEKPRAGSWAPLLPLPPSSPEIHPEPPDGPGEVPRTAPLRRTLAGSGGALGGGHVRAAPAPGARQRGTREPPPPPTAESRRGEECKVGVPSFLPRVA